MKHIEYQNRYPDAVMLHFPVPAKVQYTCRVCTVRYLHRELPGMEILDWIIREGVAEVTVRKEHKQLN